MFRSVIVDGNPDLLDRSYRLRHQVYCVENKFEPSPIAGREFDEDDDRSAHVLVLCGDQPVATARLILPCLGRPLPARRIADFGDLDWNTTAEISRFAVTSECRGSIAPIQALAEGLIRAGLEQGVSHVIAMMELLLLRLMRRFRVYFHPVGGLVEHHGVRQPCVAKTQDIIREREAKELE